MNYIELPNFLKTEETAQDLAGYMDSFYSMYIIRENNHQRLTEFARATKRPVINAMSCDAHPCEVLTDAYYLQSKFDSLSDLKILLWGPVTNVFKSWHSLAKVLGLNVTHYCPQEYHKDADCVSYIDQLTGEYGVVITDAWPSGFSNENFTLSGLKLRKIGDPLLIPTPPVTIGNELATYLRNIIGFAGYKQKKLLLPVQQEIIAYLIKKPKE